MRRLSVLLVTALLASFLAALGAHADAAGTTAKAATPKATTVTLRLAPSRVTIYEGGMVEPTGLVAQVTPKARRTVTFQQSAGSTWRTLAKVSTSSTGRAFVPLTVTKVGTTTYRAVVSSTAYYRSAKSSLHKLAANSNRNCQPTTRPADQGATGEVFCLLQRLDTWKKDGVMGVGQQLNVSSRDFLDPLTGIEPNVVGFDLQELADGETYSHKPLDDLIQLARDGAVLSASWHAENPFRSDGQFSGRPENLAVLLTRSSDPTKQAVYDRFWADWDAKLALLERFATGDATGTGQGDAMLQTAVVVRPFHEVNGNFFWWGQPTTGTYKRLWAALQDRAWTTGVRNIVWAYSGNRHTSSTKDPGLYVPANVDLSGLDTYDPEKGSANAKDVLNLEGYASITKATKEAWATSVQGPGSPRTALTEVGPHGSSTGAWNPAVITSTAKKAGIRPLWAMLWFDDTGYDNAGLKEITSLSGGPTWLRSCYNSLCYLR